MGTPSSPKMLQILKIRWENLLQQDFQNACEVDGKSKHRRNEHGATRAGSPLILCRIIVQNITLTILSKPDRVFERFVDFFCAGTKKKTIKFGSQQWRSQKNGIANLMEKSKNGKKNRPDQVNNPNDVSQARFELSRDEPPMCMTMGAHVIACIILNRYIEIYIYINVYIYTHFYTDPKTNIGPETLGLEDEVPFGKAYFQGLC